MANYSPTFLFAVMLFLSPLFLISCATVTTSSPKPKSLSFSQTLKTIPAPSIPGIYHRVEKGQTLWRIAKMYGVDLEEILESNTISDAAQVTSGQTVFIPRSPKARSPVSGQQASLQDFIWPSKGRVVSQFGDKISNTINKGITIRGSASFDVVAANAGVVVFTNEHLKGYGKTIIIAHEGGILTVYSLLSEILIKPGEHIPQGALIAHLSGGLLHFEIRKGHIPQNPFYYLPS